MTQQVNWNSVCGEIQELHWRHIWPSYNHVEVLNEYLSVLLGRYVCTNHGRLISVPMKHKPWFDDQRMQAFDLWPRVGGLSSVEAH